MQAVKDEFPPYFLRQMVNCYFGGVARFCSCLYWVRSIPYEIKTLRFYYVMAASAIIRLDARYILGGAICKKMSVTEANPRYLQLLKVTGLPSIKDMALTDAVATVKQVVRVKPEFFTGIPADIQKSLPNGIVSRFFRESGVKRKRSVVNRYGIHLLMP